MQTGRKSPSLAAPHDELLRLYQPAVARDLLSSQEAAALQQQQQRLAAADNRNNEQGHWQSGGGSVVVTGRSAVGYPLEPDSSPSSSPATAALSAWEARKRAQRAAQEARIHAEAERFREAQRKLAADEAARRDAEFESTLSDIVAGIIEGRGITGTTQAVLDDANRESAERQQALYSEWREQVFDKIQARIHEGMSHRTVAELEDQLQAAAASYVAATNTKPLGVYLDVVIPGEYDALGPAQHTVKIATHDVFDPVKKDLLKTQAEQQLLNVSATSAAVLGAAAAAGGGSSSSGQQRGGGRSGRGSPLITRGGDAATTARSKGSSGVGGTEPAVPAGSSLRARSKSAEQQRRRRAVGRAAAGEASAAMGGRIAANHVGSCNKVVSSPDVPAGLLTTAAGPVGAAALQLAPAVMRETLQTTSWGALQIKATPHGHCISSEGEYIVRPPAPAALAMAVSRLKLDDFTPAPPEPYRPSKRMGGGEARMDHIDDVVKWRCAGQPGSAGPRGGG